MASWIVLILIILVCIIIGGPFYLYLNHKDPNKIYKNSALKLVPANDEIRLLHLEPGNWNDEVKCKLVKTGLGSKPKFFALSYAWEETFPSTRDIKQFRLRRFFTRLPMRFPLPYLGDSRKRLIWVNERRLQVGLNLELALRHLRNKPGGEAKVLWADAICINQDDFDDRNSQVATMKSVYQNAQWVEIWLGAERDICSPEMEPENRNMNRFTPSISEDPREGVDVVWGPSSSQDNPADKARVDQCVQKWSTYNDKPKVLRTDSIPDYTMECFCMLHLLGGAAFAACDKREEDGQKLEHLDVRVPFLQTASARGPVLEVFDHIMNRLWWNRLWVVQETVLARHVKVRYGRFLLPWQNLVDAATNFSLHKHKTCCSVDFEKLPNVDIDKLTHFANTVTGLNTWRTTWTSDYNANIKIKLLRLLWEFRSRSTMELRDKIYALIPLANYWGPQNQVLSPQYQWPIAEVYKNAVRNLIAVEKSLSVLMGNTKKSDRLAGELPSWVPDWSEPPTEDEIARLERAGHYRASGEWLEAWEQDPPVRFLGDNEFLEVQGVEVDEVKHLSDVMPKEFDAQSYSKAQNTFRKWRKLAQECKRKNVLEEDFWKTMCMDTVYASKANDDDNLEFDKNDYRRAESKDYDDFRAFLPENDKINVNARKIHRTQTSQPEGSLKHPKVAHPPKRRDTPRQDEVSIINRAVESATVSRRFFVTKGGRLGLGPAHMDVGDFIHVLVGGSVPFLLRKAGRRLIPENDETEVHRKEENKNDWGDTSLQDLPGRLAGYFFNDRSEGENMKKRECHILIGDCFVNGIMDGEALLNRPELSLIYLV